MRRRLRNPAQGFRLCVRVNVLGALKVIKRISLAEGEDLVLSRRADIETDASGEKITGFVLKQGVRDAWLPSNSCPSSTVFSRAEMNAIAGSDFPKGASRTKGMSDYQRSWRVRRGLPEMDLVESALNKLEHYQAAC